MFLCHHIRQRGTVHFQSVVRPLLHPGHLSRADDCLPPAIKRGGGAVSPPTQGSTAGQGCGAGLVATPPLGPSRHTVGGTAGRGAVAGRSSHGLPAYPTRRIPHHRRAAAGGIFGKDEDRRPPHPPRPVLHKNTALPTALPPDLAEADFVFFRQDSGAPPLTPPYTGPFKVLRRSLHTFQVQVGNRTETISTHRLKSCFSSADTAAAEPPRRGRPPLAQHGAKTPYQNPGEKTTSKIRAEADRRVKSKKCPQSVKTNGKNPRFRAPSSSSAPSKGVLTPPLPPHRRRAAPLAYRMQSVPIVRRNPREKLRTKSVLVPVPVPVPFSSRCCANKIRGHRGPPPRTAALPSTPWERGWVQQRE